MSRHIPLTLPLCLHTPCLLDPPPPQVVSFHISQLLVRFPASLNPCWQ